MSALLHMPAPAAPAAPGRPMLRVTALIAGFLALQYGGEFAVVASQCALILLALSGSRGTLIALTLSWLVATVSPGLVPPEALYYSYRFKWLVLLAAAARTGYVAIRQRQRVPGLVLYLAGFVTVAGLASLATSFAPLISVFKLLSFFVGATTVVLAYDQARRRGLDLGGELLALALVVSAASLPLLWSPLGYKYVYGGTPLFKGILVQPQEFAVFLAPVIAWLSARAIAGTSTWPSNALLSLAVLLLIASGSRTGVGATLGGLALPLAYALLFRTAWRQQIRRAFGRPLFFAVLCAGGLVVLANVDDLARGVTSLVYKRAGTIAAELHESRGFLVARQMENFRQAPLFGIGFGMPSSPADFRPSGRILGVPLTAPTEKGVLYVSVLEECGLVGAALLALALLALLRRATRGSFPLACMVVTILMNNAGEANLFAFGGMGLYYWLILGYALYGARDSAPAAPAGNGAAARSWPA